MECSEFLKRFSEYVDGSLDAETRSRFDAHESECPSCRRYEQVVEKGAELFRSLDPLEVPQDFRPRLQHRIYHVEDGDALPDRAGSSGVTAATALGMAVLLSVAAWSPTLRAPEPEVELEPITASRPFQRKPLATASLTRPLVLEPVASGGFTKDDLELWARSHELLFRFSSLSRGQPAGSALRQVGVD